MKLRRWAIQFAAVVMAAAQGCGPAVKPPLPPQPYIDVGYKPDLPKFMRNTVFERTDTGNTDPYPVTGYSLVVNLQDTGDNSGIPTAVRQALIKRMALAGFGQHDDPRFTHLQPEQVLVDRRVAIVRVIGMLPPGARRGQMFDLVVQAMPRSRTTSLAHGHLYNTELRNRGLEQPTSGGMILAYADAGDVFVNPVYALEGAGKTYAGSSPAQVTASLRSGTVLNCGRVTEDRPLFLQLRVPQASIARTIESRVNNRFPAQELDRPAAAAQDDGLIHIYVPLYFYGNWKHFVDVVNHLYLSDSPDFAAQKIRQLVAAARQPQAPLMDISFCLEGFGPSGVAGYQGLLSDPDPAIAYAAARAAVFCGDAAALDAMTRMAMDPQGAFQLAAIHTIGELAPSAAIDKRLEPLLGSDQALVRIEAYKILAAHGDRRIVTQDVGGRFKLDIVDFKGPPLIYATRSGPPRIALFGPPAVLAAPIAFAAMRDRLTISSDEMGRLVNIFYRDPLRDGAVRVESRMTMSEVIARLGGAGPLGEERLNFSYPDIVAVVQALSEARVVMAAAGTGQSVPAPFVLDQSSELTDALVSAALEARPQADPIHPLAPAPAAGAKDTAILADPAAVTNSPDPVGGGRSPSVPSFGNP